MRYLSTRTRFDPEANDYFRHHLLYLARGRDHAGNTYGDPTRAYPELARYKEVAGLKGRVCGRPNRVALGPIVPTEGRSNDWVYVST